VSEAEPDTNENKQRENEEGVIELPSPARATLDKVTQPKSCKDKQLDKEDAGKGVIDMPDVFDHRDSFNYSRRNNAEDQRSGAERADGYRHKDPVADKEAKIDQRQQAAEENEEIRRRIGDEPIGIKGSVEDVVEQADEQTRLDLIGMGRFLVRHIGLLQRLEKGKPDQRCDEQERNATNAEMD
jgi:hypothetical protein